MTHYPNKLTVVLKIYSVCALVYALYVVIEQITSNSNLWSMPAYTYILTLETPVAVIVCGILVWNVFRNKDTSALFLPCLILGIAPILVLIGVLLMNLFSNVSVSLTSAFWYILIGAAFLLIAVDSRRGSAFAKPELIILAVFETLFRLHNIIWFALALKASSHMTIFLQQVLQNIAGLLLSPAAVVILLLLRKYIQQRKPANSVQPD